MWIISIEVDTVTVVVPTVFYGSALVIIYIKAKCKATVENNKTTTYVAFVLNPYSVSCNAKTTYNDLKIYFTAFVIDKIKVLAANGTKYSKNIACKTYKACSNRSKIYISMIVISIFAMVLLCDIFINSLSFSSFYNKNSIIIEFL